MSAFMYISAVAFYAYILTCRFDYKPIMVAQAIIIPSRPGPHRGSDISFSPFQYSEFTHGSPTYTIISHQHRNLVEAIEELKRNKINYVFIDAHYFTKPELIEICAFYKKPENTVAPVQDATREQQIEILTRHLQKNSLVFLEDKDFIGGLFELYEVIFRYGA